MWVERNRANFMEWCKALNGKFNVEVKDDYQDFTCELPRSINFSLIVEEQPIDKHRTRTFITIHGGIVGELSAVKTEIYGLNAEIQGKSPDSGFVELNVKLDSSYSRFTRLVASKIHVRNYKSDNLKIEWS